MSILLSNPHVLEKIVIKTNPCFIIISVFLNTHAKTLHFPSVFLSQVMVGNTFELDEQIPGKGGTHIFSWIRMLDVDGWVLKG